jgi:catecholate siderophore receptor
MNQEELAARRLSRLQIGVGSTICLASSFGLHAEEAGLHAEEAADKLSEVVVTARPSINAITTSLQDTAQNVSVVPQELMIQQAANTVQDALKNVPGITLNAGEGGTHGDNINLRGFAASDDFFLDGLRDTGFYTRDSFNLEGIGVYKGPA